MPSSFCAFCLAPFAARRADQRYCSDRCRILDWKAQHPRLEVRLCLECGEKCGRKFCSPKCRFIYSARAIKHCGECGEPLTGKRTDSRFCSDRCRIRHWERQHPHGRDLTVGPPSILPLERLQSHSGASEDQQAGLSEPTAAPGSSQAIFPALADYAPVSST